MLRHLLFSALILILHVAQAQCPESVGASFQNNTPFPNPGCGSTSGEFLNTSAINLTNVATFEWDYGNGIKAQGTTDSADLWAATSYTYTTNGTFNVKLTVTSTTGCTDSFTMANAVGNVVLEPRISKTYDIYENNKVCFTVDSLKGAFIPSFLWNFGNPPAGQFNFVDYTFTPCFNFPLGPNLVTLRLRSGPCDITVTDTVMIKGPGAAIEAPFNRIKIEEKFQCGTSDSVHFTNASIFYNNDTNPLDEDSLLTVVGKSIFAFNYTLPASGSGLGVGDQTPLASAAHISNRTMGDQVVRIWNFGDEYAPQCTTSLAKGLNIGANCNFSEDEFPVHKYQSWDSIYHSSYFLTNHIFTETGYEEALNQCITESIDTNDRIRHRSIYDATIPNKYNATLELHDTVTGYSSNDNVLIDFRKPDASKMTKLSGAPCAFDGVNQNYINQFKLNTGGQSYFAVNYDTLYFDPEQSTSWNAFNGGSVYAQSPDIPIPFVIPYEIVGSHPDEFYKGYTAGRLGNPYNRTPFGSISMGIIVGNGPATMTQPATCLDTAYYHDIVRIKPLDASFEILSPTGTRKEICAGENAYFKLNTEIQEDIGNLRLNYGYSGGFGKGPSLNFYLEDFNYLQPYTGPKPGRNDAGIAYSGEDWLYNSVTRINVYGINGRKGRIIVRDTIETIVTAIIKDWKTEAVYNSDIVTSVIDNAIGYNNIPKKDMYKLWGSTGTSCIDTTGLSDFLSVKHSEYKTINGDDVVTRGDKRYRYTDATKIDSVEVAHILHFRDSSLQGYDTLIVGTDTTFGVWKHSYTYKDSSDGQLKILNANGPMFPNLIINNLNGCEAYYSDYLNVGYHNVASVDAPVYKGEPITLLDNIRYWQYGEENIFTYPFDSNNYWNNPSRVLAGTETFKVDWDASNGITDWKTGINQTLNNTYAETGTYTITMASKDRLNCRDTFSFDIEVLERPTVTVDFVDSVLNPWDCNAQVLLSDLSFVTDTNCSNLPCDSIVSWNWTFSNGDTSTLQNPTIATINKQDQTIGVKLVATSANGLSDSIERNITIFAGNLPTRPDFSFSVNDQTLTTEVITPDPQSTYDWSWGDGSTSSGTQSSNPYANNGVYNTTLTRTDTASQCLSDSTKSIAIGGCNAYFGYEKDTTTTFAVILLDSSTGTSLSYLWNWGDGNTSTSATPTHDYDTFGRFLVTLTVNNVNCSSTYSDSIGMDANGNLLKKDGFSIKVGTANIKDISSNTAKIYPNPSDGELSVTIAKGRIQSIEAFAIDGRKVALSSVAKSSQEWDVQLEAARGQYVLVISTNQGTVSKVVEVK